MDTLKVPVREEESLFSNIDELDNEVSEILRKAEKEEDSERGTLKGPSTTDFHFESIIPVHSPTEDEHHLIYRLKEEELRQSAKEGVRSKVKQLLEDRSLDADAKNRFGFTAMHMAAFYGRAEIVRLLIHYGADVSITTLAVPKSGDKWNRKGDSPLHLATIMGHENIVQILLDNGANFYIKDKPSELGMTPLELGTHLVETGAGGRRLGVQKCVEILTNWKDKQKARPRSKIGF